MTPEEVKRIQNMSMAEYAAFREGRVFDGQIPSGMPEDEYKKLLDQLRPTPEEIEKTLAALQERVDTDKAEAERLALRKILGEQQQD